MKPNKILWFVIAAAILSMLSLGGCGQGYRNSWLYPEDIKTVYVQMLDTGGFRRGYEYELTDAVCKMIESQTPYKIVSDRNVADSVLSGNLGIHTGVLAGDPYTGKSLQNESLVTVTITWKNLKTGQLLIDGESVSASNTYSTQMGQTVDYSIGRAVNKAAQKAVELMQTPW